MAIELHVFLQDGRIPTRAAWQQTIERLGFPTVLDPSFDVRHDTGFSPTTYHGQSTGFEFYLDSTADILPVGSPIMSKVGARDKCATFRWSGMSECAAAVSAAAALAKLADGIYFYPEDNSVYSADEAVEATRKDLASIRL